MALDALPVKFIEGKSSSNERSNASHTSNVSLFPRTPFHLTEASLIDLDKGMESGVLDSTFSKMDENNRCISFHYIISFQNINPYYNITTKVKKIW
jgi:hypothetical protein